MSKITRLLKNPLFLVGICLLAAYWMYPSSKPVSKGKTQLTLWTTGDASESVRALVEVFQRKHPEYEVLIGNSSVRDQAGDPTRFLLSVAGKRPPDVIHFDRFAVVEWASRGAFTKLNDFLEADKDAPDAIKPEDYYEAPWDECIYKGNVYSIPIVADSRVLFYNADALKRAGFVYGSEDQAVKDGLHRVGDARPPQTWNELCYKKLECRAEVLENGVIRLPVDASWRRQPVKGDVVTVIDGQGDVFRARIAGTAFGDEPTLELDLRWEQPEHLVTVPETALGNRTIKVFDKESYIVKLSRFNPRSGRLERAGFIPFFGNSWLYDYGWANGGRFMSKDGKQCTLNDPRIVEALAFITDMYDSLGGKEKATIFQSNPPSGVYDMFVSERILMRIDSIGVIDIVAQNYPSMDFGVASAPISNRFKAEGGSPTGMLGGYAYAIPATSQQKEGAWKLLKFLASKEAAEIEIDYNSSMSEARGNLYVPRLHPNRKTMEFIAEKYVRNSMLPEKVKEAFYQCAKLFPHGTHRPVTPVGQLLWNCHVRAAENGISHTMSPQEALDDGTRMVQDKLNYLINPPTGPKIPWDMLIGIYVVSLVLILAFAVVAQWLRYRGRFRAVLRSQLEGYVCAAPWMIGFFTLGAGPILFSIIISFSYYDVLNEARFIGWENYINLFKDDLFWVSLKNTLFMIIQVPLNIICGLLLAMLLNHQLKGINLYRALFYLPAITPAVAAFILWMKIFDPNIGYINQLLFALGVDQPPSWLLSPEWAKPSIIIMGLWGVGGSMIIWIAGLKSIPETLYEAAEVDGASRLQQFFHITLPMLSPYIFFNLVMGMINVFKIFEQAYVMTDGGPQDSTMFYAYRLFNLSFRYLNMGMASAMAWILFAVVVVVTCLNFWLGKKYVHY